jgi:hypothetical protein
MKNVWRLERSMIYGKHGRYMINVDDPNNTHLRPVSKESWNTIAYRDLRFYRPQSSAHSYILRSLHIC